jgi:processive 1,2-diacylglycerol beta-glucosyltransferase
MKSSSQRTKRILVASVSAGAGHVRAGEALKKWGEKDLGVGYIEHRDVLGFTSSAYKEFYAGSYLRMANSAPELWGYLFRRYDRKEKDFTQKILHLINKLSTGKFAKYVRENEFDSVIATHFLAAEILLREKRHHRYPGKIYIVVTDFGVHRFWVIPELDGYFVATEEVKEELMLRGIPEGRIFVTGIPVLPEFSEPVDRKAVCKELGFSADIPTFLVMGWGFGIGESMRSIAEMLASGSGVQIIFICGRNEKIKTELERLEFPDNVRARILGFVEDVWKYMEVANVIFTKPGGLTISEALARSVPILIINPIPGQEELNSDFLLENGLALKATSIYSLKGKIRKLLTDKTILRKIKRAAKEYARPFAGRDIISKIVEM